jgi:hypothetical protein
MEEIEEKNQTKRRLIVLGLVMFGAVFYFVWQNYLNFGYIEIKGDAPYSVFVFDEKTHECTQNPCTLKLKRGEKGLLFSKPGYTAKSQDLEVTLWDTVSITVLFKINPYFKEIPEIPETMSLPQTQAYEMVYDQDHHNWKLIEKGDKTQYALSYFAEKLNNPIIVGTSDAVLVIEEQVYFIDLLTKKREALGTIEGEVVAVIPSYNGQYFLIYASTEDKDSYYIAENDRVITTQITSSPQHILWTYYTDLAVLNQDGANLTIKIISPETLEEKVLIDENIFQEESTIEEFFPSSTAKKVYFRMGETAYEITY